MPTLDVPMPLTSLNLVDAGIQDLLYALKSRAVTSVELVSLYLHRIAHYDTRGPSLNSICVFNPNAFEEAQKSDDYRASGRTPRPLEGIPFTVKDSFMVKGMTVAAGSPAFANLVASDDAAIVTLLRDSGAIILGKTNMPAMADGGGQRGLYGRAESPYNLEYSTTAYASGSSNGCGTSTAASFAAFGFAGETVSSGRAPASNNALVGYSPSRGILGNRGQWPLYPTCDVIVPHTRSVQDLFYVLNVIVADDPDAHRGFDFWQNQSFTSIPRASEIRPDDFQSLKDPYALLGKRIAVPRCFLGAQDAKPFHVCTGPVHSLFEKARTILQSMGATTIETDFPLLEKYVKQDFPGQSCNVPQMPNQWTDIERCQMIATAWDDFLRQNGDSKYPNLLTVDTQKIHPRIAPMDDPSKYTEQQNQVRYPEMIESVRDRKHTIFDLPGIEAAVHALEDMRKVELEDWMDSHGYDMLAFPTNGDVPYSNSDEVLESMLHALQNGVKYSNGGRVLKHCGVPCITLPMGTMSENKMPVGITFASKAHTDNDLLRYAYAYEAASRARTTPSLTPPISSDHISLIHSYHGKSLTAKPELNITSATLANENVSEPHLCRVSLAGTLRSSDPSVNIISLQVFVDGKQRASLPIGYEQWTWEDIVSRPNTSDRYPTLARVPKDCFLIVVIARLANGRSAASMLLVD
ncbi:amidase family protein [Penicillium daleae]|uniref:Amidase family protein n=1 Tax=Penicillium daleae TaxID=63821 RepID=A0AAD6CCN7_9EURO|nr:amidase family protein [Penicillium daleae]KAJ5456125.1 amidase family protein [Penicillium daleae]